MTKNKKWVVGVILAGMVIGLLLWWYWPVPTYKAYVGFSEEAVLQGKGYIKYPSWVAEVDLLRGEVTDTFPLSKNVPVVGAIAVDWKRNRLYAGGQENVMHPEHGYMPSRGIDVYDLETKKIVNRLIFPTTNMLPSLGGMRLLKDYEKLLIKSPRRPEDVLENKLPWGKDIWIIDSEKGEIISAHDAHLMSQRYISPSGKYFYTFFPGSSSLKGLRKSVYSLEKEQFVEKIYNQDDLLQEGGWQPDPKGKYEAAPFILEYPQTFGRNPLRFYDRETLELLAEVDLAEGDEEISHGNGATQMTVTRDNRYMVSLVGVKEAGPDANPTPFLKVIDMEKFKVIKNIPLRLTDPENIRTITNIDVY